MMHYHGDTHLYESSPLLLVSTTTTQKKSKNDEDEKKRKRRIAASALGLVVGWCSILACVASMKSLPFGMPRGVHELGQGGGGENTNHHHRSSLRRLGESEEDVAAAASLGTLPRRTWGSRSGTTTTTTTSAPLQTSGEEESDADAPTPDAAQQQQQQQQQQPTKPPQTLKARVWEKSASFVKEEDEEKVEEEEEQQQEQQQQQQQQNEETNVAEQQKVVQNVQVERGPVIVAVSTKEDGKEVQEEEEGVLESDNKEMKEERVPVVVDVSKEQEEQQTPRWRLNMQNIARSASDALLRTMSTSNTKEELLILEDEKEKERIDADIVEQQNLINVENEHKRKEEEEEEIEAAKEVEPKMGENEEQAPPKGVMENLYDIDNGRYEGEIVKVPFAFYANTKWAGADFWKHDWDTPNMSEEQKARPDPTKYMPVFKTYGVDSADVVVTAHATNIESTGWVIIDSAKRNGLQVVISGNGTDFHGFADKMMGLKAALHSINGNPIVISTDANDVMLQCSGQEFKKRFNQANADFIFGGETQLWPEIHAYFGRTDEIAWKEKMSDTLGKIGAAGPPAKLTGEHPNVWANAGSFMARKNDMLKYIEETEQRMARHPAAEPKEWGMTCRPAGVTDEDFADVNGSGWVNWFDDQECLTSFQMRHLMDRSLRHKLDADGSILFSAGGTPMNEIGKDNKNMVFHKQTGKASCLWHFNNPQAKIRLKDFANTFPDKFLTPRGREVMLSTSDEHPGNRDPTPSSEVTLGARAAAD